MTTTSSIRKRTPAKKKAPAGPPYTVRKLDLACGQRKKEGFKGIDIEAGPGIDIAHDLFEFPWPIKASVVSEINISHFAEHIPHTDPRWPKGSEGFFLFFDEVFRVMKKGGTVDIVHPYVMSGRAFWDPTHVRFIHEASWYYLDKDWRTMQGLDHYPIHCDFEVLNVNGNGLSDEHISRSADRQLYERTHLWNVVQDLSVTLRARK